MEQRGEERADWTSKGKLKGAVSDFNKVQAAMEFLRQKEISTVETLDRQLDGISETAVAIRDSMRKAERRIKDIDTLLSHIGNYEKYKPVYKEYAAIGWKKQKEKFAEAHRASWTHTGQPPAMLRPTCPARPTAARSWRPNAKTLPPPCPANGRS